MGENQILQKAVYEKLSGRAVKESLTVGKNIASLRFPIFFLRKVNFSNLQCWQAKTPGHIIRRPNMAKKLSFC